MILVDLDDKENAFPALHDWFVQQFPSYLLCIIAYFFFKLESVRWTQN